MIILREKYIYLISFILIQFFVHKAAGKISCLQCGNNPSCTDDVSEKPIECPDNVNNCYTKIDSSGKIERGCCKQEDENTCKNDNNCQLTGDKKNDQFICRKCESSDENCSQTDMKNYDAKYNQFCDAGIKKCLAKVDNKLVVRGCAGASDECSDKNICKICDRVNCNSGVFPENRRICYHCNGNDCNDVANKNVVSKPCLNYEEKDNCYTKGENDTTMIRGCKSDAKENKCSSDAEGCTFCAENNCNKYKYKHEQELKCYQCISNETDTDCLKQQSDTSFNKCEKELLYSDPEFCYTNIEGGKVQRGCLHDNTALSVEKCKDGDTGACTKCNNENGCNNKRVEFTCIRCRSDEDKKCWNNAQDIPGQTCRTDKNSQDGCFFGIWNGVAIRGCIVDASIQNQVMCKDPKNKQCTFCTEKDCNIHKASSGSKIALPSVLMLIVLTNIWYFK